jgi:hypothetical protein
VVPVLAVVAPAVAAVSCCTTGKQRDLHSTRSTAQNEGETGEKRRPLIIDLAHTRTAHFHSYFCTYLQRGIRDREYRRRVKECSRATGGPLYPSG